MGSKSKLIVFDFETGGLDPKTTPAMEIGLVTMDQVTLQEEMQWESLIKPYNGIGGEKLTFHPKALETHGISVAKAEREGKPYKEIVEQFIALCKKVRPPRDTTGLNKPILCGHNVGFDIAFLEYMFNLCDKRLSEFVLSNNGQIIPWDTQQMAGQLWNVAGEGRYDLRSCCEKAGLGNFLAHSALSDARTTSELIRYFISRFRQGTPTEQTSGEKVEKIKRVKINSEHKTKFQF